MVARELISSWMGAGAAIALLIAGPSACNYVAGTTDLEVAASPVTAGGSGSGGGDTTSSSSTGVAPTACVYPTTGFTNKVGGVVPPKKWQGYAAGASVVSTLAAEDYYDCDGTKGINALLIDESALWCGACQEEAMTLDGLITSKWDKLGIKVLTLMVDDAMPGQAATEKTALTWQTQFKLKLVPIGVDPGLSFAPVGESTIGLPLQLLVDPRTMKIIDIEEGFSDDYSKIEGLAAMNQKK